MIGLALNHEVLNVETEIRNFSFNLDLIQSILIFEDLSTDIITMNFSVKNTNETYTENYPDGSSIQTTYKTLNELELWTSKGKNYYQIFTNN